MSSPDKSCWYSETKNLCFDARLKIPDATFMLFVAPHCVAANANFGKEKHERTDGAVTNDKKPTSEEIWQNQKQLLEFAEDSVKRYAPVENKDIKRTIKDECYYLKDEIIKKIFKIEDDKNAAGKNSSYKKAAYLNLYLGAKNCSPQEILEDITNLYKEIFDKIYSGYEDEATLRLKALKSHCERRAPELEIDGDSPQSKQMAQCTAALLFLDAEPEKYSTEYCNIRHALFGIPEPDSASTLSIPTIESMQIKTEHYIRMCMCLLVNNPNPEDLEMVYSHLISARRKSNGFLDGDFIFLAQELKKAVTYLGNKVFEEIVSGGNFPGTQEQQARSQKLIELLGKCEVLLSTG